MSETLFISDVHLDPARPDITRRFLDFLDQRAALASALYILGDLFELWIGDDDSSVWLTPITLGLTRLSARVPVYFLHGNRDFLIGCTWASHTGMVLLPEAKVIDLYGEPVLLMHGDTLCTDDIAYQRLRTRVRNRLVQRAFLTLSPKLRQRLAQRLRQRSEQAIGSKPSAIMDVNTDAITSVMRHHQVRRLIHGHTHRPGVHELTLNGLSAWRYVLGSWYARATMLRCTPQDWALVDL